VFRSKEEAAAAAETKTTTLSPNPHLSCLQNRKKKQIQ